MKQILMGTSALAFAALTAGSAMAAEAPELKISGSMEYFFRTSDNDDVNVQGSGSEIALYDSTSEIVFDVNAIADNGLEYGAQVQWRYGANSIDEAWLEFGGNWGKVYFGDQDGAVDGRQIAGASVLAKGLHDEGRWMDAVDLTGNDNDYDDIDTIGLVGESSDASKIYYETPSFSGFSAAVSYTPDSNSSFGTGNNDDAGFDNVWETSLAYDANFNGVGFSAMVGALGGDPNEGTTGGVEREDDVAWLAGAMVNYAGFEVAAGYGDRGEHGCVSGTNCDMGMFYDFGVAYNFDALKVGAAYFHSEANENGLGSDDELDTFGVEANYQIAEGLSTFGGVLWANSEDGDSNDDRDSTVFVVGTALSF